MTARAHLGHGDQAAIWAVRYCLGRRSNDVEGCSRWLREVWCDLDSYARVIIQSAVEEEFARDDAARANGNFNGLPLGDDVDRLSWTDVLRLWRNGAA
jgi:hypothetical protein